MSFCQNTQLTIMDSLFVRQESNKILVLVLIKISHCINNGRTFPCCLQTMHAFFFLENALTVDSGAQFPEHMYPLSQNKLHYVCQGIK